MPYFLLLLFQYAGKYGNVKKIKCSYIHLQFQILGNDIINRIILFGRVCLSSGNFSALIPLSCQIMGQFESHSRYKPAVDNYLII